MHHDSFVKLVLLRRLGSGFPGYALIHECQHAGQNIGEGEQIITLESGVLGEYSQFDPNQWQSINVSGLDLRALTSTVNQTMEKCQRDADRPLLK